MGPPGAYSAEDGSEWNLKRMLTLKTADLEKFYAKILEYAEVHMQENNHVLELDAELLSSDFTPATYTLLTQFEPFGVDNVKPKFLVQHARITSTRLVGKQLQHLQMQVAIDDKYIDGILFSASDFAKNFKIGDTVDIAAELIEDTWNGRQKIKLRIVDIRDHVDI